MPKRTHTCVSMPPTPSAVNLCPCSIPRNWVSFFLSFLFRPTDDVMHEPQISERISFVGNGRWCNWVERISFVGNGRWCNWVERISFVGMEGDAIESNGFLLWVWKVMQLSRTDFFLWVWVWCNWCNSVNTCEFVVGEQFCNSWIQHFFFLSSWIPYSLSCSCSCSFVFYLLGLITFHGPQQLSSRRV